jgi:hypothetical protein
VPNTFLKPSVIAAAALGLLQREIVVPGLLWTDAVANFAGAAGDTVTIRVPARTSSRRRSLRAAVGSEERKIITDELTEQGVDVTLTDDVYNSIGITDEELSLDIKDFGAQVLNPQVRAVAEGLEDLAVEGMDGSAFAQTVIIDPAGTWGSAVDAFKALNDADVPRASRSLLVGSGIEAAILKDPQFVRADQSGDQSNSAMREAKIGRVAGFDVYGSNAIGEDEGYAFHRTAWALGLRAPMVPQGATFGNSQSYQGLAMRWLKDYDYDNTRDRSLVDCYAGIAPVLDDGAFVRAVRLELLSTAITISDPTLALAVGDTATLTVDDSNGEAVPGGSVGWTSDTPAVATVSSTGKVTAVAAGTATITASYQGQTATCAVTVS